jgi:hypothetical protein
MGGFLSGQQRWRNHGTVEATRELDMSQLKRAGCLEPGWQGTWQSTINGSASDPVDLRVGFDHMDVGFWTLDARGKQHKTRQTINIVRERCRFGGNRKYFLCPGGVHCGRRVTKLYWIVGGYILCRHCHRLAYASQSENELGRARRSLEKIERRLGEEGRPKGMWRKTYDRLVEELIDVEMQFEEAFTLGAARLLTRLK